VPASTPNPDKGKAKTPPPENGVRYVRCELNKAQKEQLAGWAEEAEDVDLLAWVHNRVSSGHVLSIRSEDVGYRATLTGMRESSGHLNQCLISRASTSVRALQSLWFKDEVLLSGAWPISGSADELDF
jgi:hypothetical protein